MRALSLCKNLCYNLLRNSNDRENGMKITLHEEGVPVRAGGAGLFLEDINYALDGGLYAEMLENRNFEAKNVHGKLYEYIVGQDGSYAWSTFPAGGAVAVKVKDDRPLFVENPHYLRIEAKEGGCGIVNKAYDGVYLRAGQEYKLSFWVRSYTYKAFVTAGVYDDVGAVCEVKCKPKADGAWRRFAFTLKAKRDCERAQFRFVLQKEGILHVDNFSLMPENAVMGLFRRDIAEMLRALKPGFLRFPGGCVVEGNTLANRYQWKHSVGQTERRRHNWNRWAVHGVKEEGDTTTPFSHYGQTLGIGYYEYFLLCEYLGCKALPVVSVGIACQYMSKQAVPVGDELESYIQDALDVVEFANGDKNTVWGRVRIEMGHPEPFGLEYLGVGNEQWETEESDFYRRFEVFAARIREKYPEIKVIGTVGPAVGTPSHAEAWKWTRDRLQKDPGFVYASDEHFYMSEEWMYANTKMYDAYPRGALVYAGEYATHIQAAGAGTFNAPQSNTWASALAEAAFMTGMERNADVVVMRSYAPLLARLGYTQWSPDLIWFDGASVYGTPNYYVQKLYSLLTGDMTRGAQTDTDGTYVSATSQGDLTYVKVVNAGGEGYTAQIEGDFDFGELLRIVRMQGEPADVNSMESKERVAPFEVAPAAPRTAEVPPHSFQVLVFRK